MTRRGIAPLITGLHIANGFHALIFPCFQDAVDVVPLANPGQCSLFDSQQDEVIRENLPPLEQGILCGRGKAADVVLERPDNLGQSGVGSRKTAAAVISYSVLYLFIFLFIFIYLFLYGEIFPSGTLPLSPMERGEFAACSVCLRFLAAQSVSLPIISE